MAHSGRMDDEEIRRVREAFEAEAVTGRLGPTDRFPEGRLTESDEGEIRIAVGVEKGKIVLHFGEPTMWVGMTPEQAVEIAGLMIQKARAVTKSPFTISL